MDEGRFGRLCDVIRKYGDAVYKIPSKMKNVCVCVQIFSLMTMTLSCLGLAIALLTEVELHPPSFFAEVKFLTRNTTHPVSLSWSRLMQ